MTLQEQFTHILEKQQENNLIPFFTSLTLIEKKTLVPHIKVLYKEYMDLRPTTIVGYSSYARKATQTQERILKMATFFCFSYTEFRKLETFRFSIDKYFFNKVLEHYCPDWFSDYINEYSQTDFVPYELTYEWLMQLTEKGFLDPSKELIVKVLPQSIYIQNSSSRNFQYKPENLLERTITLQEHIWYLFELESNINWSNRYMRFEGKVNNGDTSWIGVFNRYNTEGKIDRNRLLKECLLATTRNFNKTLSGWFAQLFIALEPTPEELLALQDQLFITFNSPHSKPVTTSLQYLKKVAGHDKFDARSFLDTISLLLSSQTKSVVSSTLFILEKLAKNHVNLREQVCQAACQVFIHRTEELQIKAAKLILKYGDSGSQLLKDTLVQYQGTLLSGSKTILKDFITETTVYPFQKLSQQKQPKSLIEDATRIQPIHSIDELVFLVSQAFDNNESYHFDLLPAALLDLQEEIRGENIPKLLPAFQRAYKLIMDGFGGNTGSLDHMLAIFFIDYGKLLVRKFPKQAKAIEELQQKYTAKDENFKIQWSYYDLRLISLQDWKTYNGDTIYEPFKRLLLGALEKSEKGIKLPLLSTPTHSPGWIDPIELINRLSEYQREGIMPEEMDFQIALSRCVIENTEKALQEATTKLRGEYRELIKFLFSHDYKPSHALDHQSLWIIAALTKAPKIVFEEFDRDTYQKLSRNHLTGQFPWKTHVEAYTYDWYDYAKRTTVKVQDTRKTLQLDLVNKTSKPGLLHSIVQFIYPKKGNEGLLYDYLTVKDKYFSVGQHDIRRLLFLTPHNPEPILAQITHACLKYSSFGEDGYKKILAKALETLLELWKELGEMAHLFVATCLLCSDKTVRSYAAEIWLQAVNEDTMNSELMGEILGKHERIEFAPLTRLTDVMGNTMLNISDKHNQALERLLTSMLIQLPEKPVHNLKKLLQLYAETLAINTSGISNPKMLHQLSQWKSVSGLGKIAIELEKKAEVAIQDQLLSA